VDAADGRVAGYDGLDSQSRQTLRTHVIAVRLASVKPSIRGVGRDYAASTSH
jgi:hypothetical protein